MVRKGASHQVPRLCFVGKTNRRFPFPKSLSSFLEQEAELQG